MAGKLGINNIEKDARAMRVLTSYSAFPGVTPSIVPIYIVGGQVGVGINPPTEFFHIHGGSLKVSQLDNPDLTGGELELHGTYTTPANQQVAGLLRFRGRNDVGGDPIVVDVYGTIEDITASAEKGGLRFVLQEAGADVLPMAMVGNDVLIGNGASLFDNPEHELDVRGTIQTRVAAGDPQVIFDIGGVNKFTLGVDDSDSDRFKLAVGSALGTNDVFTIDSSGNMGFGISPPVEKFHFHGGSLKVSQLNNPDLTGGELELHGTYTTPANQQVAGLLRFRGRNNAAGDPIVVDIYGTIEDISAGAEKGGLRFVLQELGADVLPLAMVGNDVLIGNGASLFDNPEHELDVRGTIQTRVAAGDPQMVFDIGGVNKFTLGVDDSDSDRFKLAVGSALGTNDVFTIDSSGNMGFGISPPVEKFHFHGGSLKVSQLNNPDLTGGELELHGTYTTPANQQVAGLLRFRGRNNAAGDPIVVDIYGTIEDISAGAEKGGLRFVLQEAGADVLPLAMVGNDVLIGNGASLFANPRVELDVRGSVIIDQGAADGEILAFKSSDVAHGMTTLTETDTFGTIRKGGATDGGVALQGFADTGSIGLLLRGYAPTDQASRTTGAIGYVTLDARKNSGTGSTDPGADANLFVIRSNANARFLVDADGDIHMDATSNQNAWDEHDDIALLAGVRQAMNPALALAEFVEDARPVLARTGVVTYNDDGHHFISLKALHGLQIDALRQMHRRNLALEERIARLEQKYET